MTNSTIELKGLRGLRELASGVKSASQKQQNQGEPVVQMPIDKMRPGKYQPRRNFDETALRELADSIKNQGIIQPIIVRLIESDNYEIIEGERRWRAAQLLALDAVPVIVKKIDDETAIAFALIENLQREDLNPIEEALSFSKLQDEFKLTHAQIAEMLSRSRSAITNTMRLLSLQEPIKDLIEQRLLEMGHARALLSLLPHEQVDAAMQIVERGMTVRQAEQLAQSFKKAASRPLTISPQMHKKFNQWCSSFLDLWANKVDLRVDQKGKGRVIIHVDSASDLEKLIDQMKNGHRGL